MAKKRELYLDYLRILSCVAVIIIHVFVTARTDFPIHSRIEEIVCQVFGNILHFAVPVFFMITGYLFLSKEKEINYIDYFKKYVIKYIFVIFTIGFSFSIIEEIFKKNINIYMPLKALCNTIQGKTWAHMWYLYSLIGVMIALPFVKAIIKKDDSHLKYLTIVLLVSSIIIPNVEALFNVSIGFDLIITSPYLLYCIIGYVLGSGKISISNTKNIIGIILSIAVIAFTEVMAVKMGNEFFSNLAIFGNYNSIIILIMSSCIFSFFKNIKNEKIKINKIINEISLSTYGIYLFHMFWINLIYKYFKINIFSTNLLINAILMTIVVFFLSYFTTKIIKCIPIFKKYI